ncbi:hypothetical protein [Oceanobacillus bengalensis]|nr:hypothetical protein [Oceanobacillus bengalensis]
MYFGLAGMIVGVVHLHTFLTNATNSQETAARKQIEQLNKTVADVKKKN